MDNQFEKNNIKVEKPKRMRPRRPLFLIPIIIVVLVAAIVLTAMTVGGKLPFVSEKLSALFSVKDDPVSSTPIISDVSQITSSDIEQNITTIAPDSIKAITLDNYDASHVASAAQYCAINNLNTIIVPAFSQNGTIYDNNAIKSVVDTIHKNGMLLVVDFNLSASLFDKQKDYEKTAIASLQKLLSHDGIDGIMLSSYGLNTQDVPYSQYLKSGFTGSYDNFIRNRMDAIIKNIVAQIKNSKPSIFTMLKCSAVWAKQSTEPRGILTDVAVYQSYSDGHADTLSWINSKLFDFAYIENTQATTNAALSFNAITSWWQSAIGENAKICMGLSASLVGTKQTGWSNPDQLTRQLMALNDAKINSFAFDSYLALSNDKTGSTSVMFKYLAGNLKDNYILKDLTFTSPSKRTLTVTEDHITFVGASDPEFPITLNGNNIDRTEFGYFSLDCKLKVGQNKFTFVHKGKTITYNVTYRYVVLKAISPSGATKIDGSSTMVVSCVARAGSKVTATFNGKTITLSPTTTDNPDAIVGDNETFSGYAGSFKMPDNYTANKSYGKIKIKATHNGISESMSSGTITVLKTKKPTVADTTVYPTNSKYVNVGAGLIGEVTRFQGETFTGNTVDDKSLAYNNFLPKGTVDYVSPNKITYGSSKYNLMRYGNRIYSHHIKVYEGTLPSKNNISVASTVESSRYTTLTLNVDWKAPFNFELKNQKYNDDRSIDSVTFSYVSINFCYAGSFDGSIELDPNNPVFSGYQIVKNEIDYTLILKLRKTAAFYGWTADYNEKGQLVFKFLKPAKITPANNDYGYSLNGVRVLIDVGHGGNDGGSPGKPFDEADLNLILANKLKSRLESIGATVIMTRTTDATLDRDVRIQKFINSNPDFMVSIHRNAATTTKPNGFGSYYFNAFSKSAAQHILTATKNAKLYNDNAWTALKFHYFYMCRYTPCPTVLTENGFMTNSAEYQNLVKDEYNEKCADALTKGIINYFKSIQ